MNDNKSITPKLFSELLGIKSKELPELCIDYFYENNMRYRTITNEERDALLLKALKKVDSGELSISGKQKKYVWEKGWKENSDEFHKTGNLQDLIPKFVRKNQPVRMGGKEYIYPESENFETNFVTLLRIYIFKKYFFNKKEIHEFGCGTGLNLVALAKLFPESKLMGYDWAQSSVEILNSLRRKYGYDISGYLFDMFNPDSKININEGGGVFTIGAMEQLGTNYKKFLKYLIAQKPSIVINIETIYELYNPDELFDYVSIRYLESRNWLRGYYKDLLALEKNNVIKIHDVKRPFGSFFHDGYSFIVWEPIS